METREYDEAEFALLVGLHSGYRSGVEFTNDQRACFERHREVANSFDDLCRAMGPQYEFNPGVNDDYAATDAMCYSVLRRFCRQHDGLQKLPEFWTGFKAGMDDALKWRDAKRG